MFYRVAQEALTNVARHAQATRVRVELSWPAPGEVMLQAQDDGKGMDTERATRGLGLLGAIERAAAVGGELKLRSTPGSGMQIVLCIHATR